MAKKKLFSLKEIIFFISYVIAEKDFKDVFYPAAISNIIILFRVAYWFN